MPTIYTRSQGLDAPGAQLNRQILDGGHLLVTVEIGDQGSYVAFGSPDEIEPYIAAFCEALELARQGQAELAAAGHAFVAPGQVSPGRVARDACMKCGKRRSIHQPSAETGQCTAHLDGEQCRRYNSHEGDHVADSGVTWDMFPTEPADVDPRCSVDWGNGMATQRCALDEGHAGGHRDQDGHTWPAAAAFPVIPAEQIAAEVAEDVRNLIAGGAA
jgi:hypothetical protein